VAKDTYRNPATLSGWSSPHKLNESKLRPALVLSPVTYNEKTSLMLCCPMSTQVKNYPFEVRISTDTPSVVLSDQVKSVDWRARKAKHKGKASQEELAEVRGKIHALIG